jgi:hypothetical protein
MFLAFSLGIPGRLEGERNFPADFGGEQRSRASLDHKWVNRVDYQNKYFHDRL